MKRYPGYLIITFIFISLCSCAKSEKEQLKQLEEKVLAVHDEVMGQMDKIYQKKHKLQASLQKADTTQMNTRVIRNQIADLKKADDAMMDWMHQYKSPADLSPEKANVYLQDQLVKIELVKKQVTNALANADY
ncbi:hypothetical protein [Adhaeribacter radiodurans]|uniref:Viral A-type inclusion protein n=1 Tax=Adhaeribacter radiodurans TaxID=2745197 RepID=A0A7L7L9Q2_9BACT|nr:hypothetical protein [Adhaeribacter radiodurans]QMU29119.1 hypothetical protein HUW48_14190 [Adhaeribacter radiodurans]